MQILCTAVQLYVYVLVARILLSWFPITPGSTLASVFSVLYKVTEPVLGPLRRLLPPVGIGGMGFDLSPIIVFLVIQLLLLPILCT
ncbi:MAG: YggT family protein [Actinomycetota bacterium]|nr:YggT family protein [Actinomycetota bacterium]